MKSALSGTIASATIVTIYDVSKGCLLNFAASLLWQHTLAKRPNEPMSVERERLRSCYLVFRERAGELATEIGITLPQLTKHDLSHIDSLWEISSELVRDELARDSDYINPLEAFVLGGAFLIHDLAQSEAALPCEISKVYNSARYRDALRRVSGNLGPDAGRDRSSTTEDDRRNALLLYLRDSHAELARGLVNRFWEDDRGSRHYLLMDEYLREFLGNSIGRVAASHHLPVDQLLKEFSYPVGSPPFLHFGDCDLFKLSVIIRAADAINFDARRAPSLVACFRKVHGVSKRHWDAQKYLHKPSFQGDSVLFTSDHAFSLQERDAWWQCFDSIGAIDAELLEIDALLTQLKRPRLRARSACGANSPLRLQKLIPTAGWLPVDTQIRVNNVIGLVTRLGGNELYGHDLSVPLRELVQNARDAIAARGALDDGFEGGRVSVSLLQASDSWLLTVEDDGIGMSEKILSGPLLDFGGSFWNSDLAASELPGLQSSSSRPVEDTV